MMEVKNCSNNHKTVVEVQDDYEQETTTTTTAMSSSSNKEGGVVVDDHQGPLPGFRFHPTDEELVSFYLKRKVEKRPPLNFHIIKQIDIYKHDPWDLAKGSSSIGDKEWYFYCKRGRKYRNSIRPNRVTGSGFWKATGIDRPIYSNDERCVGLKKSLVYYRGSAGKGTKTDWMMHEFRLPSQHPHLSSHYPINPNPKDTALLLEAEIWTLCRIFKRNKRQSPDWREISSRKKSNSKTSSSINPSECYMSFASHDQDQAAAPNIINSQYAGFDESNNGALIGNPNNVTTFDQKKVNFHFQHWNHPLSYATPRPSMLNQVVAYDDFAYNWDDLSSVVDFASKKPSFL